MSPAKASLGVTRVARSLRSRAPLAVEEGDLRLRIALAGGNPDREDLGKLGQMRGRERHIERAECLGQPVLPPRADERHYVVALRRHPGNRNLCRRRLVAPAIALSFSTNARLASRFVP